MKMLRNRAETVSETICILGNFQNVKLNKDGTNLQYDRNYSTFNILNLASPEFTILLAINSITHQTLHLDYLVSEFLKMLKNIFISFGKTNGSDV